MHIRSVLAASTALALALAAAPSSAQDKTSIADKPARASAAAKATAAAAAKPTNAAGAKLLVDRSAPAQMSTPAASRAAPLGEPATKSCHDKGSDA
jgi:hypothetical protein